MFMIVMNYVLANVLGWKFIDLSLFVGLAFALIIRFFYLNRGIVLQHGPSTSSIDDRYKSGRRKGNIQTNVCILHSHFLYCGCTYWNLDLLQRLFYLKENECTLQYKNGNNV